MNWLTIFVTINENFQLNFIEGTPKYIPAPVHGYEMNQQENKFKKHGRKPDIICNVCTKIIS